MCVVAFAWNTHPRWRLLLTGNRDEFHARPTTALAKWHEPSDIYAGRDLSAGGTWLAADVRGRVAVVTNVRNGAPKAHQGPSRGHLPIDYLAQSDTAAQHMASLETRTQEYAPFNLIIADADECRYLSNRPALVSQQIDVGIHAISNGALNAPWPKAERLRSALQAVVADGSDDLSSLWAALVDESHPSDARLPDTGVGIALERRLSPIFIRGADYGTRASTIAAIDHNGVGFIHERRFGPDGEYLGETKLDFGS